MDLKADNGFISHDWKFLSDKYYVEIETVST